MGYRCLQIGCVLAEYNLLKLTIFIQNFIYICRFSYKFDTVLNQLYIYIYLETGTSDRNA